MTNKIKRISKYNVKKLIKDKNLNIVDIACGRNAGWPEANVYFDVKDWSKNYPGKKFIVGNVDSGLPFKDNEFDFSIASHILEHCNNPLLLINELQRISNAGYIELPTPLIDNLCSGPNQGPFGHKWWCFFDDWEGKIILRKKRDIVHRTVEIPELHLLYPFFKESFLIELYWDKNINIELGDEKYFYENKEYDLSKDKVIPWVLGASVLSKGNNEK